jgi:hypothetical protein
LARGLAASAAAIGVLGCGAGTAAADDGPASTGHRRGHGSSGSDISHTSRWSHAEWTSPVRNTNGYMNIGDDDPAGGGPERVAALGLTQSWCDTSGGVKVLVSRELAGDTDHAVAVNRPRTNVAFAFGVFQLRGTVTRTPAGTGATCGEPSGPPVTRKARATALAVTHLQAAPGSEPLEYQRPEETGSFYYRDAVADGAVLVMERDGYQDYGPDHSAGSWFWEGIWTDATGVEITPGV